MKRFLSVFLVVVIIAIQMISFCGCNNETQLNKYKAYYFDYFDTATTIIGYANTQEEFDKICEDIKSQLNKYHRLFTIYNRYEGLNNLVTINDADNGKHDVVTVDR